MGTLKRLGSRFQYEIFALLGTLVILWQMLLPGYVLTLDLTFGPLRPAPVYAGLKAATYAPDWLIYVAHSLISGWLVEKIILFGMFFLLFYLPLRFYPFSKNYGEAYFVSLLYTINPFVYERLLAGQWKVLFAYAFLFPFVACLIRFYKDFAWRPILMAFAWLLLIGMFALHMLVMGVFILFLFGTCLYVRSFFLKEHQRLGVFLARFFPVLGVFIVISLYWVIPAFNAPTLSVSTFTEADSSAFQTAGDKRIGTEGNVAALYGFWGEHETWSAHFHSPKEHLALWETTGALLAVLIAVGVFSALIDAKRRFIGLWLVLLGFAAFVFSIGVGDSVFRPFNAWLFENIWFWRGFRDTEKWSGVLVLAYALFAGIGLSYLLSKLSKYKKTTRVFVVAVCALPLFYTPTMLFGFAGQLSPVEYPAAWAQANAILSQDKNCAAVFLPWHQYYTPIFNHRILTGNTARLYFSCTIYSSADAEIGDVGDEVGKSAQYYAIEKALVSDTAGPNTTIRFLKSQGIEYLIFTNDEVSDDSYKYPFLRSSLVHKVIDTPTLVLFSL